ncbi:hypothetical protein EGW08_015221, partial [Elysia chlorotica]
YDGELVIAGLSGRYPESDSVSEFRDNLLNKVNMVTVDDRRWDSGYWDTPAAMAKLKSLKKFDAEFFGVHSKSAETLDPQLRILLEVAYEAVVDAGESLESMKGTRTGVYVGVTGSEAEHAWMGKTNQYVLSGCPHTMFPNRLSFFFDLRGPSCAYDTACSTSIVIMEAALMHLRAGVIDQAIVGSVNLIMRPQTTKSFVSMNMLGGGACRAFDAAGDGFVRAETISACLLKKAEDAKRIFCTVEACLSNNDGWSNDGLLFPNTYAQEELMRDFYSNYKIDPREIKYFECHGTGTPAGDPNEMRAICSVMCADRKEPLLIGSTKTNMGHGEVASGFSSMTKVLVAMHTRLIPPNLHFQTPNPKIPGLFDGRLKVVTETTPWDGGMVALNSFGMGGTNAHIVLRSYDEKKAEPHPASGKARLFTYSARTEDGLKKILEEAHQHAENVEFHALCQQSANSAPGSMPYRGATLLNAEADYMEIQKCSSKAREVWFVYSGMGSQWVGMGRSLMALDVFRQSIVECSKALEPFGVDLINLIMNGDENSLKAIVPPFVCIAAVQIGLTDLLFSMGVKPDGLVGHSLGEGSCAYADGCLTRAETVISAYFRGQCVVDSNVAPGKMAAVGLSWEEAKEQCPPGVVAACHNSADSVTISGGAKEMTQFMEELSARGVFVKEVNSNNVSYHSQHMEPVSAKLKAALDTHVKSHKARSAKWVSTSVPEELWDSPIAQYAKGDYQANNLRSPVLFYEGLQKVPKTAVVVEVAPIGLLQSVIKRAVGPDCVSTGLQKRNHDNNLEFFFTAMGKLFSHGVAMNPLGLYPDVQFPVSRDTPLISSLVAQAWDHSIDWAVPRPEDFESGSGASSADTTFEIDVSEDSPDHYLVDHQVDGRALFPACGCLVLAWQTLATLKGLDYQQMPVRLTNVQIRQAMFLPTSGTATIKVSVMPKTGEFQVCENENVLASGVITSPEGRCLETEQHLQTESVLKDKVGFQILTKDEVYRELIARGYEYGHCFQGVQRSGVEGEDSDILWDGRWISYLDAVLQMILLGNPDASQALPVMLETVNIDPTVQPAPPAEEKDAQTIPGHYDKVLGIIAAGGVEMRGLHTTRVSRRLTHDPPFIGDFAFHPFKDVQPGEPTAPYVPQKLKDYADAIMELSRQTSLVSYCPYRYLLNVSAFFRMGLRSYLNMSYNEPYCKDYLQTLRPKIHDLRYQAWDDPVLTCLDSEAIIKLCFDTVTDNLNSSTLHILEAGAIKSEFFRDAFPKALNYFHLSNYHYSVVDKFIVDSAMTYPVKILMFDTDDATSFPDTHNEAFNLLILKHHLRYHNDLDLALEAYSKMVKPGGFILVFEAVERVSIMYPFESLVAPWICNGKAGPEGERILGCYYTEPQWRAFFARHGLEEIIHRSDGLRNAMFLLRKPEQVVSPPRIINVDDLQCSWIEDVKAAHLRMQDNPDDSRLWLVATEENSGIWGLVQSLRWEPGFENLRCVHVSNRNSGSKMPQLTVESPEFKALMRKDLVYNIYRDGRWGTYRTLVIHEGLLTESLKSQVFADCYVAGDPLSLKWFDSPLNLGHPNGKLATTKPQASGTDTCAVYFAGVNDRDVLLANASLKKDDLPTEFYRREGVLGVEFSGRDSSGKRVMGLCAPPALASGVRCPRTSLWLIPTHWTLEEAATVPLAYATAFYALVIKGRVKPGETIFVQSGYTPVGQAVITIALSYDCKVFTTTRDEEDTKVLLASCPKLQRNNIYNNPDLTFERSILIETDRKGVDIVVNVTNDSTLKARVGLLAKGSRFIDLSFKTDDEAQRVFSSGAWKISSFHKVQIDAVIASQEGAEWTELSKLMQAGIEIGVVKPLKREVYTMRNIVDAFKAVDGETSKKVLIQVRDEEGAKTIQTPATKFPCVYRKWFDPAKCYVIIGGLGGLGLELSDWMVCQGVKKLVVTSRSGITTGYQAKKIAYLRQLGAEVVVVPISVNTLEKARGLLSSVAKLGPIGGFFNMGMVLDDNLFAEQSVQAFLDVMEVKINATMLLDQVSREEPVRSSLDHFVVFSSIVGFHGHIGQSNYGLGNAGAERICERRAVDGLPGLAIQWGPVGDVGFVGLMGNNVVVGEKHPQRLHSIKSTFEYIISQESHTVVTSYVPVDRSNKQDSGNETAAEKIVRAVGKVL